jgi:nucleoside 2-deoxyribosyltransferase
MAMRWTQNLRGDSRLTKKISEKQNQTLRQTKIRIFVVCVVRADWRRWLEYGAALALRKPLAGLIGFGAPFRS